MVIFSALDHVARGLYNHHAQKWNISRFETTTFKFRHSNKSAFEKFFIIGHFYSKWEYIENITTTTTTTT
jgi:hypothetical protein